MPHAWWVEQLCTTVNIGTLSIRSMRKELGVSTILQHTHRRNFLSHHAAASRRRGSPHQGRLLMQAAGAQWGGHGETAVDRSTPRPHPMVR